MRCWIPIVLGIILVPAAWAGPLDGLTLQAELPAVQTNQATDLSIEPEGGLDPGWTYAWTSSSGALAADESEATFTASSLSGYVLIEVEVFDGANSLGILRTPLLIYTQLAIIKADDYVSYNGSVPAAWQAYFDVMNREYRLKHTVGVITECLNNYTFETGTNFTDGMQALHVSGLGEIWHHGLDHSGTIDEAKGAELSLAALPSPVWKASTITEFFGQPYAFQKAHLENGLTLSRDVLGFPMVTFGAPFGMSDSTTITVVDESADIANWYDGLSGTAKRLLPVDGVLVENPTGYPLLEQFNAIYDPEQPLIIMQVHPGYEEPAGVFPFSTRLPAWRTMLDTVLSNQTVFLTAAEYDALFDQGAFPLYPGRDTDTDGIEDWNEGNGDTDGDGMPDFLDFDSGGAGPRIQQLGVELVAAGQYEITFELADADTVHDIVVELDQGGGAGFEALIEISGDLTGLTSGNGYTIDWDTATELPGVELDYTSIRLTPVVSVPASPDRVPSDEATFTQGCTDCVSGDTIPSFQVRLSPYELGTYEVTNGEFADVLNYAHGEGYLTNPSGAAYAGGDVYFAGQRLYALSASGAQIAFSAGIFSPKTRDTLPMDGHPVTQVTWYGAAAYCNWLSEQAGLESNYDPDDLWRAAYPPANGFRLPSEAEWEHAAGWVDVDGAFGFPTSTDTLSTQQANYSSSNPLSLTNAPFTTPGGYYDGNNGTTDSPSPLGAYDMAGNAAEWCADRYDAYFEYSATDPIGSYTGPRRVVRGGAWADTDAACETTARESALGSTASNRIGFRIARSVRNGDRTTSGISIDNVPPQVTAMALESPVSESDLTMRFTVTFSEPVEGLVLGDFDLTANGIVVIPPALTSLEGSGDAYVLEATTGTMQGSIDLELIPSAAATDEGLNPIDAYTETAIATLNTLAPAVTSLELVGSPPDNADTLVFSVMFSGLVVAVVPDDFTLQLDGESGPVGPAITDVSGAGPVWLVTVAVNEFDGQLGLALTDADNSIQDILNQPLRNRDETGLVHTAATRPPRIVSLSVLGNPAPNAQSVSFGIELSEPVTGLTQSDVTLLFDGSTIFSPEISGFGGSGSMYCVAVDTGIADGMLGLAVDGASPAIDSSGLGLLAGASDASLFAVDTIAPEPLEVALVGTPPANAQTVDFLVTYTEPVIGVDTGQFEVYLGGTTDEAPSVAAVNGSGSVWTVTVDLGVSEGVIDLLLVSDDSVTDLAGNTLASLTSSGEVHAADTRPPRLIAAEALGDSPTAASTVKFTLAFSEPVGPLEGTQDEQLLITSPGLTLGAVQTRAVGDLAHYEITISGIEGAGTISLTARETGTEGGGTLLDTNGNGLPEPEIPPASIVVDRLSPTPVCSGATVALDENGMATLLPEAIDAGSSDTLSAVTLVSVVPDSFSCEDIGIRPVVLNIADALGNAAHCTGFVRIADPLGACVVIVEGEGEGGGEGRPEGEGDGSVDGEGGGEGLPGGEGEGILDGEGGGEGDPSLAIHSADWNGIPDHRIDIVELLRVIQLYNAGEAGFCCGEGETEDGFTLGPCENFSCSAHAADYEEPFWEITLTELLRVVQFFNLGGYYRCPEATEADGFCAGPAAP